MKVVVEVLAAAAVSRQTCDTWMALAIMTDATDVMPALVSKENVGAKVDGLSTTLEPPPKRANSANSIATSIVTSTSASFGIALVVVSDPKSAMRRTPGRLRAARTKEPTATSKNRRGSATEDVGP
jgi:hypothetical protein